MSYQFEGKVVFITGGARGIGKATAHAFAKEGARVAVVDYLEDEARKVAKSICTAGGEAIAITCDVRKKEDITAALDETILQFGGLDIAFNNAGIEQTPADLINLHEDHWDDVILSDLKSVFLCMKYQIPLIQSRGGGAIVNTSSTAGVQGVSGQSAYTAAKHGVIGLTRAVALEHAPSGLRINALCPGIIHTPMIERISGGTKDGIDQLIKQEPIERLGNAEEMAAAVLYLCSDAATFAIGHALVVDGGQSIRLG